MAILTLLTALRMRETGHQNYQTKAGRGTSIAGAFKLTLTAAKWILKTPFALVIILADYRIAAGHPFGRRYIPAEFFSEPIP